MFRVLHLEKSNDDITLKGQLRCGFYCAIFPSSLGIYKYIIKVTSGYLRLNHTAFNPDGGTWSCYPKNRQQAHYDLTQAQTYEITVTVGTSFGKTDRIDIVNKSMTKNAEFTYKVNY
jgi:hypothetical protein